MSHPDHILFYIYTDDDDTTGIEWKHTGPVYVPAEGDVIEHVEWLRGPVSLDSKEIGPLVVRSREIQFHEQPRDGNIAGYTYQVVHLHCVPAEEAPGAD